MSLFVDQRFTSHSGLVLAFKIECDALTDDDWACLAHIAHEQLGLSPFQFVFGVPGGGVKFAQHLTKYIDPEGKSILLVDDVYTTGSSIRELLLKEVYDRHPVLKSWKIQGIVAFSRGKCPDWIRPIFQLNPLIK